MTLLDASRKIAKPWSRVPGGFLFALSSNWEFRTADKAAVIPHFTSGNEVEIPRDL